MQSVANSEKIAFAVEVGDVITFDADVIALKFAQSLYGADGAVARALGKDDSEMAELLPTIGSHKLLRTRGKINAKTVLFLSVPPLHRFRYEEIRGFGAEVLKVLASDAPSTVHLAMTIHGVGYGLDEAEALKSQLAGLLDALESKDYPSALQRITFVDRNKDRAQRLRATLEGAIPNGIFTPVQALPIHPKAVISRSPLVSNVGRESSSKPHVFVLMSLPDEMDDIYYLGIKDPANEAGYLCEKANLSTSKTKLAEADGPVSEETETVSEYTTELHKLLVKHLNEEELRTLCFSLKVDYDILGGEGKAGKARELVLYLSRRARLLELVESAKAQRPDVPWPDILQSTPLEQLLLEREKPRIDTASFVIADITTPDPSVFLLIGYSWGKEKPTILLARDLKNVPIDVRSQRCIVYGKIRELKEALTKEFLGKRDE